MSFPIFNPNAIFEGDLTTPTLEKNPTYPLGAIYNVVDTNNPSAIEQFMYVKSHAALTQYQPYTVVGASTASAEVVTAAPATLASGVTVCIPQVAFTSGYYGFVQIFGACTAKLAAETHVAGDYLELLTTGTTLIVDGTSGATAFSAKSVAVQVGALTGAGTTTVFLFSGYRTALVSAT
jgi:hypothetical protein